MTKLVSLASLAILSFSLGSCNSQLPAEEEATLKKINTVKRGKVSNDEWSKIYAGKNVYETYCSGCHGLKGDGKGDAANMLAVKPRNFVKAMYKFISTPKNTLPSDIDLHRTLLRGIPRSSMPSWKFLSEDDRTNVIAYIKTFSDKWQTSQLHKPIAFPNAPEWVGGVSSVALGKTVYAKMGCANCHGEKGMADGPASNTLKDAEGNPMPAFKFTDGILKGGNRIEDIYRTFYTGLAGTPMPAYGGILSDDDNWHLVSYVLYLMGKTNVTETALSSPHPTIDTAQIASKK